MICHRNKHCHFAEVRDGPISMLKNLFSSLCSLIRPPLVPLLFLLKAFFSHLYHRFLLRPIFGINYRDFSFLIMLKIKFV